jgi:hypothetical protein
MTFTYGTYKFINCYILSYTGSTISETEDMAEVGQRHSSVAEVRRNYMCQYVGVCWYVATVLQHV